MKSVIHRDVKEGDWNRREISLSRLLQSSLSFKKDDILSCLNNKIKPKEKSVEFLNLEETEAKEANDY